MVFGTLHRSRDPIEQRLVGDLAGQRADVVGQLAVVVQLLPFRRIRMVLAEAIGDAFDQVGFGRFGHVSLTCTVVAICALLAGCDVVFDLQRTESAPPIDAALDAMIDTPVFQCPPNYEPLGTSYYRRLAATETWADARANCILDEQQPGTTGRTHLVVLSDQAEYDLVHNPDRTVWIGLSDTGFEGVFAWVTAEPMNPMFPSVSGPPWGNVEPNDANTGEDCAALRREGDLNDASCLDHNWFVCECDAYGDITDEP